MAKREPLFELTRRQYRWGIVIVLLISALLYFYKLGEVPHGMTWDEAAIGYNGFAIFTTRRDEWLTRLPISFWSFGDYKAPLAIYLNGLFTFLFGLNLWAVRLPFALFGLMAVLGMVYLTRLVFVRAGVSEVRARLLALGAGILMVITPWHHHFARAGFESGIALSLYVWAFYFFLQALTVKEARRKAIDMVLSAVLSAASIYAYHSAKIVVPLSFLVLAVAYRKQLVAQWRSTVIAALVGAAALGPFVYDSLFGKGLERAGTLIINKGYGWAETAWLVIQHMAVQFSPRFLVGGWTTTLRHGDGLWGVLLPMTLMSVLVAFIFALRKKTARNAVFWYGVVLVLVGLLPAALADELPHSNRALLALPGFLLLAAAGWQEILSARWSLEWKKIMVGMILLLESLFFVSYLQNYYTRFAAKSATDFQDGMIEALTFALPYERGGEGIVPAEKIIVTSQYGQPYIYALFVRKTNPLEYHGGSLIKYEFKDNITIGDIERPNTLVIAGSKEELFSYNDRADKTLSGSDGSVRFRIFTPR